MEKLFGMLRSKPICQSIVDFSFVFVQCLRRFVKDLGGRSSWDSTLCPHAMIYLYLATVIHSLSCHSSSSSSKLSCFRVVM
jgi:hypothetical protein